MLYKKKKVQKFNASIKCQKCHGTGKVVLVSLYNKLSGYRKIDCCRCGGTGVALK